MKQESGGDGTVSVEARSSREMEWKRGLTQ